MWVHVCICVCLCVGVCRVYWGPWTLQSTGKSLCEIVTFSFQVTMVVLRLWGVKCDHHAAMAMQPQERGDTELEGTPHRAVASL